MTNDGESDRKRLSIQSLTKVMRKRHQRRKSQAVSDDTKISLQPEPEPEQKEKTKTENCAEGQSPSDINETEELRTVHSTNAVVHTFHGKLSGATSYLVADKDTGRAVVIDPFLNSSGPGISSTAADDILTAVRENHYHVDRILETQGPTTGRSAVWYLRSQLQQHQGEAPRTCAGKSFAGIQRMFERKYAGTQTLQVSGNIEPDFKDGQLFELGSLGVQVLLLPARDPEHTAFVIDSNVFIGDALLAASPEEMRASGGTQLVDRAFSSVKRLLSLPPTTRIYCSQELQLFCLKKPWVSVREIRGRFDDPERNELWFERNRALV